MRKNNLKTSAVSRFTIKWCRALFATFKDISSETSSWCWQKCDTSSRTIPWFNTAMGGTINCAHCLGCKVGLAESCSHIARVLFYLEAWAKVNGRLSCMQIRCLGYFPVSQTRWNTVVSAILTLNPLRKWKTTLMKRKRISLRDFRFLRARKSSVSPKVPLRNRKCQRRRKRKWKTFILTSANAKESLYCWAWCALLIRYRRNCR